jgi:CRISPR/Cas system-associated exonuclease Cas4 (RecB family)
MSELRNELSWSKSRHERFKECRRAYYYQYYGSWGGWTAPAGSPARELYVLKKLSTRWQWAGSVVHDALRRMLRRARSTGQFHSLDDLLASTRARARAQWSSSREKSYWRDATGICGLVEHEYGEPVSEGEWKRIYEEVIDGSLRAFYEGPILPRIRETPADRWLAVDELDSWSFEGVKVWVALDFAFHDADGQTQILDWKTGKEREVDHMQVAVYALYAMQKWGIPLERLAAGLVYLTTGGERVEAKADRAVLSTCEEEMRQSIRAMRELLDDPAENLARIEQFPQVEDRDVCKRCTFRRPCGRL